MSAGPKTILALSGGVDSAVAACLLRDQGHAVECLHMSNWDDDDGYCDAATDLQDARRICDRLDLPLHRVNFAREYRESVFADFLAETRAGRTPNPDVLCNREIKFGLLRRYAHRLGADRLATGHYARLAVPGRTGDGGGNPYPGAGAGASDGDRDRDGEPQLLTARDAAKDQTYFLHAVHGADFVDVEFPLGELSKSEVRRLAAAAGLEVAAKRDSTGICFIGERPFAEFLSRYLPAVPGPIVTETGETIGEHEGLHFYTLGQRKGIGVGGRASAGGQAWYVAGKHAAGNELLVVPGHDHPALMSQGIETGPMHFIGAQPAEWREHRPLRCRVRTRYRQPAQACTLLRGAGDQALIRFDQPQRAITPGQFAVAYIGERCLGGATIERRVASSTVAADSRETA